MRCVHPSQCCKLKLGLGRKLVGNSVITVGKTPKIISNLYSYFYNFFDLIIASRQKSILSLKLVASYYITIKISGKR